MTTLSEPPVTATPRLLAGMGQRALTLAQHRQIHGAMPVGVDPARLRREIARSGLLGRGGAGFPAGRKLDAVAAGRGPRVVVGNGAESEPASCKDAVLLSRNPHLVLDGLAVAAAAVEATEFHLVLHRGSPALPAVRAAIAERDGPVVQLHELPHRYVASEASALIRWLSGGDAKPSFGVHASERGVRGRPTYVGNVETLAAAALVARHGAPAWSSVGDPLEPGTILVTVTTPHSPPGVLEVETGTTVGTVLGLAGCDTSSSRGILVGGWGGSWLTPAEALTAELSHRGMADHGGLGCAAIVALPASSCPLVEVASVAGWLAGQSAGQCGPCTHGLPAIAAALDRLATGRALPADEAALGRWATVVPRRGACAHPDGAVTFVGSALRVFASHVREHRTLGPCSSAGRPASLATPVTDGGWR